MRQIGQTFVISNVEAGDRGLFTCVADDGGSQRIELIKGNLIVQRCKLAVVY